MAKTKKELDKDIMFQKILPGINLSEETSIEEESPWEEEHDELSALRAKLFARSEENEFYENQVATINVMENIILKHIDEVIAKFNCCRCDRCRRDVAALALNMLPPKYVVASSRSIGELEKEISGQQVYSALVKAVLKVRSKPQH